jgi:hypothetical protein
MEKRQILWELELIKKRIEILIEKLEDEGDSVKPSINDNNII